MASYIEFEMNDKVVKLEFDRDAIIRMEEMGYNAIDPSSKLMTNYEVMVYGGMLKHQPDTTWKQAIEAASFLAEEYGMLNVVKELNPMVNEVFHVEGKAGKKLIRKGAVQKA